MFGKKATKVPARIDSLIGAGTRLEGNIVFSGGLRVDGEIRGNVCSEGDQPASLVISERARIEGEVSVQHAVINGTVVGPVTSTEFLELQPQARITGDVTYARVEMHLGAVVDGRLEHQDGGAKAVELLRVASSH